MTSVSSFSSWFSVIIVIAFICLVWFFIYVFFQWRTYCLKKDYSGLGIENYLSTKNFKGGIENG